MIKFLPLAILILLGSCKKESENSNNEPTTRVEVKEAVSGLPVSKAKVILFQGSIGGVGYKEFFTGSTNDNGICDVPSKYFDDPAIEFNVVADKYWPFVIPEQRTSKVTLQPEGWMKVYPGLPGGNYPDDAVLTLKGFAQSSNRSDDYFAVEAQMTTGIPTLVRAFGDEPNNLYFEVTDGSGQILNHGQQNDINVPKFDTAVILSLGLY
jgi:hypothetical protein